MLSMPTVKTKSRRTTKNKKRSPCVKQTPGLPWLKSLKKDYRKRSRKFWREVEASKQTWIPRFEKIKQTNYQKLIRRHYRQIVRHSKRSVKLTQRNLKRESKQRQKQWQIFHKKYGVITSFLLVCLVGQLLFATGLYLLYHQTMLSFKVAPSVVVDSQLRGPEPTEVQIQRLGIDLTVIPAQIKDGIWETSDTMATHLNTSARPLESGNIVIYAHNKQNMFGPLLWVQTGDEITLTTQDNHQFTYQVTQTKTVKPEEVEVVLPTNHEELTLYTCTGFLDSLRFVVKAEPVEKS